MEYIATLDRPTRRAVIAPDMGSAMRAGDALAQAAHDAGYGVADYGHAAFPTVTISQATPARIAEWADAFSLDDLLIGWSR